MAQQWLDQTGQERLDYAVAKINQMFSDIYQAWPSIGNVAAKTASAVSGAATLNRASGVITSEALTTAKGSAYTLTLTNSAIAATDVVLASVALGSATEGTPLIESITPSAGQVVIVVLNNDGTNAFNGTIKVAFAVLKN